MYFGIKGSKVKVTSHKHCRLRGSLHSCKCWLLLVWFVQLPHALLIAIMKCLYRLYPLKYHTCNKATLQERHYVDLGLDLDPTDVCTMLSRSQHKQYRKYLIVI